MSLTFKVGRGSSREEREIKLSLAQFMMLWPATRGRRLHKTRYEIPWKKLKIEVDIYHRRNHGLMVFGREITGEKRYSNVRLARE